MRVAQLDNDVHPNCGGDWQRSAVNIGCKDCSCGGSGNDHLDHLDSSGSQERCVSFGGAARVPASQPTNLYPDSVGEGQKGRIWQTAAWVGACLPSVCLMGLAALQMLGVAPVALFTPLV